MSEHDTRAALEEARKRLDIAMAEDFSEAAAADQQAGEGDETPEPVDEAPSGDEASAGDTSNDGTSSSEAVADLTAEKRWSLAPAGSMERARLAAEMQSEHLAATAKSLPPVILAEVERNGYFGVYEGAEEKIVRAAENGASNSDRPRWCRDLPAALRGEGEGLFVLAEILAPRADACLLSFCGIEVTVVSQTPLFRVAGKTVRLPQGHVSLGELPAELSGLLAEWVDMMSALKVTTGEKTIASLAPWGKQFVSGLCAEPPHAAPAILAGFLRFAYKRDGVVLGTGPFGVSLVREEGGYEVAAVHNPGDAIPEAPVVDTVIPFAELREGVMGHGAGPLYQLLKSWARNEGLYQKFLNGDLERGRPDRRPDDRDRSGNGGSYQQPRREAPKAPARQPAPAATVPADVMQTPAATTRFCASCGANLPDGAKFCASCGTSLAPAKRFCASCGTALTAEARFCVGCGAKAP